MNLLLNENLLLHTQERNINIHARAYVKHSMHAEVIYLKHNFIL